MYMKVDIITIKKFTKWYMIYLLRVEVVGVNLFMNLINDKYFA